MTKAKYFCKFTVNLTPEIYQKIKKQAKQEKMKLAVYIRFLIETGLTSLDERY